MAPAGTQNSVRPARARQPELKTVTKKELTDRIADETGLKRTDVKKIVQAFLDAIVDQLGEGNRIEFRDFGVFETKSRAPRIAQNPKTLERVEVPAKRTVKFKVGRLMRERMEAPIEAPPAASPSPKPDARANTHAEVKPLPERALS